MNLEIVDEIPEPKSASRRASARRVFEFAQGHPGKWVKWPTTFNSDAVASSRASELRNHERYRYFQESCTIAARGSNVYVRFDA